MKQSIVKQSVARFTNVSSLHGGIVNAKSSKANEILLY